MKLVLGEAELYFSAIRGTSMRDVEARSLVAKRSVAAGSSAVEVC